MAQVLVDLGAVPGLTTATIGALPAQNPEPPPGAGEEFGKASPVALVVILLLGLATIALIVSMTRRLRRLPESFDEPAGHDDTTAASTGDAADKGA